MIRFYANVMNEATNEERHDVFLGTSEDQYSAIKQYERQNPRCRVIRITRKEFK